MRHRKRILPVVMASACIVVATMWPGWRVAFAQLGVYQSHYIGCVQRGHGLVATLVQGPNVNDAMTGMDCEAVLNSDVFFGCRLAAETQATTPPKFATLMRVECEW